MNVNFSCYWAVILFLLICGSAGVSAQELVLQEVNGVQHPQHKSNVGNIARSDTIFVKANYSVDGILSWSIKLLTYQKSPWSLLMAKQLLVDTNTELNGVIDTFFIVPDDYLLGGNPENSQFIQVRVNYADTSIFANLYIDVSEKPASHETLVDFDSEYGGASGRELVKKLNEAISKLDDGDTLLFRSSEYDFEGTSFSITKALCFSGNFPKAAGDSGAGAHEVSTVFKNLKGLNIQSDHVRIENIELNADASTGYVFTRVSHAQDATKYYEGIEFSNVIFRNGRVQCFGGNGAGIEFNHVSFIDFSQGGYFINRTERIDFAPRFLIRNCLFRAKSEAINYNVRAISLDAGNTEYPVVWNQNNSTVDSCLLDGVGLGISSKTSYVNVTNCHFLGYRMDVDMIHIEEFGHHFLIDGNVFEHISPARGIYIDREIQQCHDIVITNNKWIGKYGWIISALSPYNLVMENNDFSEAQAKNPNDKTIDFTYDKDGETDLIGLRLPAKNIRFRNNTGLNALKDGYFAYWALSGDSTIAIDYPAAKLQHLVVPEAPDPIIDTSFLYRIRNWQSGAYVRALAGRSKLELTETTQADSSDLWKFTFEYPFFYHLKNVATGKYMEVYKGYTLGDIQNNAALDIFVEQTDYFNQREEKPRWYFRKWNRDGAVVYEMFPGGNEQKSRCVQEGTLMKLEVARKGGRLDPNNESLWELIPEKVINKAGPPKQQSLKIYPNPASSELNVDWGSSRGRAQSLALYAPMGKRLMFHRVEEGVFSKKIDVTGIQPGFYVLVVTFENGRFSAPVAIH